MKSRCPQDLPLCYRDVGVNRQNTTENSMESNIKDVVSQLEEYSTELLRMCKDTEQELHKLYLFLPTNLLDAMRMSLELERYANEFETRINDGSIIWKQKLNEALISKRVNDEYLKQWEDEVAKNIQKLAELFTKRKESLKVISEFYEFHEQFEIVPLLQNMEM